MTENPGGTKGRQRGAFGPVYASVLTPAAPRLTLSPIPRIPASPVVPRDGSGERFKADRFFDFAARTAFTGPV